MGPGGRPAASGPLNDATTSPCGPYLLGIAYGDTRDKLISAVHPAWAHRGALEYLDRLLVPLEFHEDLAGGGLGGVDDAGALVGHGFDHGLAAEAQQVLHLGHGGGGGHVPLVQLEDVGDGADVEAVLFQVGGQVGDGF